MSRSERGAFSSFRNLQTKWNTKCLPILEARQNAATTARYEAAGIPPPAAPNPGGVRNNRGTRAEEEKNELALRTYATAVAIAAGNPPPTPPVAPCNKRHDCEFLQRQAAVEAAQDYSTGLNHLLENITVEDPKKVVEVRDALLAASSSEEQKDLIKSTTDYKIALGNQFLANVADATPSDPPPSSSSPALGVVPTPGVIPPLDATPGTTPGDDATPVDDATPGTTPGDDATPGTTPGTTPGDDKDQSITDMMKETFGDLMWSLDDLGLTEYAKQYGEDKVWYAIYFLIFLVFCLFIYAVG